MWAKKEGRAVFGWVGGGSRVGPVGGVWVGEGEI